MSIVARGLGQPEDGPIVAGGFGINGGAPSGSFRNMAATITASATLTATLETSGTPEPQLMGGGVYARRRHRAPERPLLLTTPLGDIALMGATIAGSSTMTAGMVADMNFDADLELLMLVGAI